VITTPRFRLRPLTEGDVDHLVELDRDPLVMRFINGGEPTSKGDYEQWLLPRMLSHARPGVGFFAIEPLDSDAFVGWAHLRPDIFEAAWLEVGYRLPQRNWGQGIATEVSRALVDHAFATLGIDVVSGRAMVGNAASRHVLEKCGMRAAGEFEFPERVFGAYRFPSAPGVLYRRDRSVT
jgi:RimJ/RimL family protein N-acetyltransferase